MIMPAYREPELLFYVGGPLDGQTLPTIDSVRTIFAGAPRVFPAFSPLANDDSAGVSAGAVRYRRRQVTYSGKKHQVMVIEEYINLGMGEMSRLWRAARRRTHWVLQPEPEV